MKIKTWLQIIIFLSIVIAVGVGLVVFFQIGQINSALEKNRLANEIVKVISQRESIVNNYINYHQDETIIQWQVMSDVAHRLLLSKKFNTDEEQSVLQDMREDNVSINQVLTELIILQHKKILHKNSSVMTEKLEAELKSQLLDKGESIVSGAYRLAEINKKNSKKILEKVNSYVVVSLGALIVLIFFILLLLKIKVVDPLVGLEQGIEIIGSGNLEHKVSVDKKDEITQIINSFNKMTEKLKERTAEEKRVSEKLKESNQALQQFAYIASHDLQEPLRTISSYLQLIERRYKGKLDRDADDFIEFAVGGANRLQMMINDLLMFSRVETQGKPFVLVNLEDVLKQAQENLQAAINESKAIITHDALPVVSADSSQFVMLFQNLLSNAIKFRDKKTPVIHVSAKENNNEWQIGVKDNGIGIDPKNKDHLFVIFKRLVGRDYPGTGIGLAVCKRIVERHRGKIWVESELGKGATFYFTIPR